MIKSKINSIDIPPVKAQPIVEGFIGFTSREIVYLCIALLSVVIIPTLIIKFLG